MKFTKKILFLLAFIQVTSTICASTFNDRKQYILDFYSTNYPDPKYNWGDDDIKTAMGYALARLKMKKETTRALDMIDRMQNDDFDMFDRHQNIDAYFRYADLYPEKLKEKVRKNMTDFNYTETGSTENHNLMFKTAGYLTALAFPKWDEAQETMEHCRAELIKIMENTVKYGIKEFDSPTYGTLYITCLLSLYDHSKDSEFKNRVQMTLEWHLLNFASEWLNGYFISSTLREYYFACSPQAGSPYPIIGWLLFGGGPNPTLKQEIGNGELLINNEGFFSVLVALTSYKLPEIIGAIASDRSNAHIHRESHDMNPYSQLNYPWGFKKYTYLNKSYGLASQWDGLSLGWSAQMRRWKLTWESDAKASTFFTTHPCYYIDSEETLIGATPREQVLQHEGTLLAMYKIESGEPFPYVTGVVPVDAVKRMKEDPSGWIFFDGGSVFFGVKFFHPYYWDKDRYFRGIRHSMLTCNTRSTAVVVETCLPEEYPSFDAFTADILKKTKLDYEIKDVEYRIASYKSLKGDTLKIIYNYGRYINDEEVDYKQWPLIANSWVYQSVDGRFLNISYKGKNRVYDFQNWTIY